MNAQLATNIPGIRDDPTLPDLLDVDAAIVRIGRKIRVLDAIAWPAALEDRFLGGYRANRMELPHPQLQPQDLDKEIAELALLSKRLDRGHPLGNWLYKTAWSYRVAAHMLRGIGTPAFTRCSTLLYGRPDTYYRGQQSCAADAAKEMLHVTDALVEPGMVPPVPCDIPAPEFAQRLRQRIDPFFTQDRVEVVLEPALASKAAAGSKRITLRASALFSELDIEQLVQHEAFIHTATLLNGKHQPWLQCLGVGAPRTTRTQEGLATFSEIITGAIDIARLRRIALRVLAVRDALAGADFIDVFRFFLEAGQTEVESYRSAARIFRGGDVHGGACFTKDGAYLEGVLIVHFFVRKALQERQATVLRMLFTGRLTTGDIVALAPYRETGLIAPPTYVTPWAREPQRVLAILAFSAAAQQFRLDQFDLQRMVDSEDEVIADSGID